MRFVWLLVMGCSLLSCSTNDDVACDLSLVYGLSVTVRHSETNSVLKDGITVMASDGDYMEELQTADLLDNFFGAPERPGMYTITITGKGFQSRIEGPVEVSADECHVITRFLEYELEPI